VAVRNLINDSLLELGEIESGGSGSPEELADGLRLLNRLVASWNAQALPIPKLTRRSIPLTGAASYTLTNRPMKIKAAALVAAGITLPLDPVQAEEWTTGIRNNVIFHDNGYPEGTVSIRPAATSGNLEYYAYEPLTSFATVDDAVDLPPGYERALVLCLAIEWAGQFGRAVTQTLADLAADAKTSIFGLNAAILGPPAPAAAAAPPAGAAG
jgi:hypothetical protein